MRFSRTVSVMMMCTACAADAERADYLVRDSAGTAIIEIDADAAPVGWRVEEQPDWEVGDRSDDIGTLALHDIADARMAGDDVVIAEAGTQQIIRLHPATGAIRRIGADGDGPNEFRALARVYDLGDGRIAAFDSRRRRFVEIENDGSFINGVEVPQVSALTQTRLERTATGDLYAAMIAGIPATAVEGPHRGTAPVLRLGAAVDTITTLRGSMTFSDGSAMGAVLFGPTSVTAAADSGIWTGDTALRELRHWRGGAAPTTIVRWSSDEPRLLTEARKEQLWERAAENMPAQQLHMIDVMRGQVYYSDTVPAFSSLLVGTGGAVWVGSFVGPEQQMFNEPWPAQEWLVIDIEGGAVTRAATPAGLRVTQVGDDFVIGVHSDALGIQTVRRHRIERMGDR